MSHFAPITRRFGSIALPPTLTLPFFDGNPDAVFEDFGHLFDKGNEIVAGSVAAALVRCGVLLGV